MLAGPDELHGEQVLALDAFGVVGAGARRMVRARIDRVLCPVALIGPDDPLVSFLLEDLLKHTKSQAALLSFVH